MKFLLAFPRPPPVEDSIFVTSTMFHTPETVYVTLQGVLLLIKLAKRCGQALPVIKEVEMWTVEVLGLLALSSCIQEQDKKVESLWVCDVTCGTEEEGLALVQLLSSCSWWFVNEVYLLGEVGSVTWEIGCGDFQK